MRNHTDRPIILLVEDSEDDAYFFNRSLQKSGMTCSVCHLENGAEAVEYLSNAAQQKTPSLPSIIFLDLKMPLLNGFEVLEWMQTQTFRSSIQVIVLSGSDQAADKSRAAELGATEYLIKPVRMADFQRILSDVCPAEAGARV